MSVLETAWIKRTSQMKALIVTVTVFAFWAVVGCTMPEPSSPPPSSGGALPPPGELEEPDTGGGGAPAAVPGGDTGSGGTVIETIKPEPSAAQEPAAVNIPEASGWTNPSVPLNEQQQDMDSCFSYATAQIQRETRIDDDQYSVGQSLDFQNQYHLDTFRQRLDYYSERRRRGALFDACMESKGYTKN
jgi:hypothetical protein